MLEALAVAVGVFLLVAVPLVLLVRRRGARRGEALVTPEVDPGAPYFDEEQQHVVAHLVSALRLNPAMELEKVEATVRDVARRLEAFGGDGKVLIELGKALGAALNCDPSHARAWTLLAEASLVACHAQGDFYWREGLLQTEVYAERACKLTPDDVDARALAALFRARLGFPEEALAKVEGLPPSHWRVALVRAVVACVRAQNEAAIEPMRVAVEQAPARRQPGLLGELGRCLEAVGKKHEALSCYERANLLDPGAAWAFYNRARLLFEGGRLDEALEASDRAASLSDEPVVREARQRIRQAVEKAKGSSAPKA